MEDTLADEVIESCKSFLETAGLEDGAMISTFNESLLLLTDFLHRILQIIKPKMCPPSMSMSFQDTSPL